MVAVTVNAPPAPAVTAARISIAVATTTRAIKFDLVITSLLIWNLRTVTRQANAHSRGEKTKRPQQACDLLRPPRTSVSLFENLMPLKPDVPSLELYFLDRLLGQNRQ